MKDIAVREERYPDSKLETARLGKKINNLNLVVTKIVGDMDELKGLVEMLTRERLALHGRRDDLLRDGEWNMPKSAGLRFCLEEAETKCSYLTDKANILRFDLKSKWEIKVDLRRALDAESERMGVIEAEARTGEEMAE